MGPLHTRSETRTYAELIQRQDAVHACELVRARPREPIADRTLLGRKDVDCEDAYRLDLGPGSRGAGWTERHQWGIE